MVSLNLFELDYCSQGPWSQLSGKSPILDSMRILQKHHKNELETCSLSWAPNFWKMGVLDEHRAVQLMSHNRHNPAAGCRLGMVPTPRAGPGQVVVKMLCRPVNPSDIMCLQGFYPNWRPTSFPAVPGVEGMGLVHEVGENVHGLKVGQRVCPILEWGDPMAWQEYICCPAEVTITMPDSISNEVASQFFVNPFTVYALMEELNVPKGEYVIQTGAASVLGRMFIQYARYRGIKTINLVRRNEQKEELLKLGADEVINFTEENVVKEVKRITNGKLAYAGIDCLAGEITKMVCSSVKNRGTIIVYGTMHKFDVQVGGADLLLRGMNLRGFYLKHWIFKRTMQDFHNMAAEIVDLLERKIIEPLVGEKFPLERFADAVKATTQRKVSSVSGKILLVND